MKWITITMTMYWRHEFELRFHLIDKWMFCMTWHISLFINTNYKILANLHCHKRVDGFRSLEPLMFKWLFDSMQTFWWRYFMPWSDMPSHQYQQSNIIVYKWWDCSISWLIKLKWFECALKVKCETHAHAPT